MHINEHLSYSDYEKLRSSDWELWNEKDLSRFLVLDYFDVFREILGAEKLENTFIKGLQSTIKKYSKYKMPFYFFDKFFLRLCIKNIKKHPKKILFQNSKHFSLILEAKKYYSVGLIVQGKKDRFFALKNHLGYMTVNDLEKCILNYLKSKDIKYLYQLIKEVENRLKIINPDYIILRDDGLPIERAIVLAGRKLGIITIEVQHGLYDKSNPVFNGNAADYVLVWGDYFKNLYIKENIRRAEDVYVLGYPYSVKKESMSLTSHKKVCYLAQDYERYNSKLLPIKLETVRRLSKTCRELGLEFIYRPHPWEDRKTIAENLPGIKFTHEKENIEETFRKDDIFISFSSTALVEAAMRSKITLQLMNFPIKLENLEKLGVCSRSFEDIIGLENYLKEISQAPSIDKFKSQFNNYYLETRGNSAQRFLEIINKM